MKQPTPAEAMAIAERIAVALEKIAAATVQVDTDIPGARSFRVWADSLPHDALNRAFNHITDWLSHNWDLKQILRGHKGEK